MAQLLPHLSTTIFPELLLIHNDMAQLLLHLLHHHLP
jgi:hypothetical protein